MAALPDKQLFLKLPEFHKKISSSINLKVIIFSSLLFSGIKHRFDSVHERKGKY